MAEDRAQIVDVDEMFEAFVTKKLKQLGMKRAAAKPSEVGTMNELELNIKMRLERNMAQNLVKEGVEDDNDGPPKEKKSKKEKKQKKKKKKREKEIWQEKRHLPHQRGRQPEKELSHDKVKVKGQDFNQPAIITKESDDHKLPKYEKTSLEKQPKISTKPNIVKDCQKLEKASEVLSQGLEVDTKSVLQRDSESETPSDVPHGTTGVEEHNQISSQSSKITIESQRVSQKHGESQASGSVEAKDSNPIGSLNQDKGKGKRHSTDASRVMPGKTSAPKRDIATIRMKIELLKARSEEEKLSMEVTGLLNKPVIKKPQSSKVQDKSELGKAVEARGSESEDRKQKERSRSHSRPRSRKLPSSHLRRKTRSRSRERRHRQHHRSRSPSKRTRHHRSRSRSKDHHRKKHSRKRSRSPFITSEDKVRLLEIAKANALAQHRAGLAANSVSSIGRIVKEGSMTVNELTSLCKDISAEKDEEVVPAEPLTKETAEKMLQVAEANKIHHPYAVKDSPITFNIKQIKSVAVDTPNAEPIPVTVLSKEFPVSCGQQHRRKEVLESVYGKWQVVAKDEATKKAVKELVSSEKVFVEPEPPSINLSSVISDRISAVRQLQENPNSKEAQDRMDAAQKVLDDWTKSQQVPGQFTGHTGLTPMPKSILEGGKPAWFNSDSLKNAKQVSGIGKSLLQKMGWTPGTPLGKTMPGQLEPLSLDFKTDRKGLSSFMEIASAPAPKKPKSSGGNAVMDLSNKHPVSALMEICSKKHWSPPDFRLVDPLNMKMFTFRVIVCDDEYMGKPASNKKQAKLFAATVALQNMGLLPKT